MVVPRAAMAATLSFRYTRKMISSGAEPIESRFDQTAVQLRQRHLHLTGEGTAPEYQRYDSAADIDGRTHNRTKPALPTSAG